MTKGEQLRKAKIEEKEAEKKRYVVLRRYYSTKYNFGNLVRALVLCHTNFSEYATRNHVLLRAHHYHAPPRV